MTAGTAQPPGLIGSTAIHAGRALRRSMRIPAVIVQTFVFPILLLLILNVVFGEIVGERLGGVSYGARLVPLMAVTAALFGGLGSGASLISERKEGLSERFRSMPGPRSAPLLGRVLADMARVVAAATVVAAVGHLVGFRFTEGPLAALLYLVLAAFYGSAFGWIVLALASRVRAIEQLSLLSTLFLVLLFLNSGFVPVETYPGFLQPVVSAAPHTAAVESMLALSEGGDLAGPLVRLLAWTAGLTVVFAPLAIIGVSKNRD